ncbi:MAG: hypothetical protein VKJ24_20180 [Synechococcales bacterium]|nr:hypothetical protein [Synechococcales bacterium]
MGNVNAEEFDDLDSTLICVGKFDPVGLPILTSRHLSPQATVTFQAITLKTLFENAIRPEPLQSAYIHSTDGSSIRVERTTDGFVAYLIPKPSD